MRLTCIKFVAILAIVVGLAVTPALANGKKDKMAKDQGEVSIKTTPAGFPIMIDGQSYGDSSDSGQTIRLMKGTHQVQVLFPGKPWSQSVDVVAGKRNCICLSYTRKPLFSPCPYRPAVSAPNIVTDGDTITFTSDVSYTGTKPLAYTWTVLPSTVKIVGEADGNSLVVDSTGFGGQRITAALTVNPGYGDERCTAHGEGGTDVSSIPPPKDNTKEGTLGTIAFDMDKANLDNFAIQLQNHPDNTGYLIVYGGKGSRAGTADRLSKRSLEYLTQTRGIDRSRVVVINGGISDTDFIELWLVPPGAEAPVPTPSSTQPDQAPARQTRKRS